MYLEEKIFILIKLHLGICQRESYNQPMSIKWEYLPYKATEFLEDEMRGAHFFVFIFVFNPQVTKGMAGR